MFVGRVHLWSALDARQWNQPRRPSDRRVPLQASLRWRSDVGPMFPRLHRYEVAPQASAQPATAGLAQGRLTPSTRELLHSAFLRRFGCRCGACDVGYYGMSGHCYECGHASLSLFLSRGVPALGILGVTAFLFWGGTFAPLRHPHSVRALPHGPIMVWVSCSSVWQPIACHHPISGHGELLALRCCSLPK